MKPKFDPYNGGLLDIYDAVSAPTGFGAARNVTDLSDLEYRYRLAYDEMDRRDKDSEFAEANGHNLDLKVRTRYVPGVTAKQRVLIRNSLYSIYQVDYDAAHTKLYLYLELERRL